MILLITETEVRQAVLEWLKLKHGVSINADKLVEQAGDSGYEADVGELPLKVLTQPQAETADGSEQEPIT